MADPQQDSGKVVLPPKPVIPLGKEIYDMIMGQIEPDLVDATEEKLKEKYRGETAQQKRARMQRYGRAFKEYEKQFKEYLKKVTEEVDQYKREALKILEAKNREKEQTELSNLESTILSS